MSIRKARLQKYELNGHPSYQKSKIKRTFLSKWDVACPRMTVIYPQFSTLSRFQYVLPFCQQRFRSNTNTFWLLKANVRTCAQYHWIMKCNIIVVISWYDSSFSDVQWLNDAPKKMHHGVKRKRIDTPLPSARNVNGWDLSLCNGRHDDTMRPSPRWRWKMNHHGLWLYIGFVYG